MKKIAIPTVAKKPKKLTLHGDTRVDNYFWLREKENPDVIKYLKEENAYFESEMKPLEKLKKQLYKEMKARIKENDTSVPASDGSFMYYKEVKKGKQYSVHLRKPKKGGTAKVILDSNKLAKGKKYFNLNNLEVAPDENILAYCVDFDGSEQYTVHFKDLKTGKLLKDNLKNCSGSFAWAYDSKSFFYVVQDQSLRPYRVYRHTLGQSSSQDVLVYEEKDGQFFLSLYTSQTKDYIYLSAGGSVTTETWFLNAFNPTGKFTCIQPRKENVKYSVVDRDQEFWIRTNYKALNFQVMKTSVYKPGIKNWKPVVKHSPKIMRTGMLVFANHLVLTERENGLPQIRVYDIQKKKDHVISFPDAAYDVNLDENYEFETDKIRLTYSSPITPVSILEYDMVKRKFKTLKVRSIPGYKKSNYVCKRVWVKSHDGVKVPLTVVHRKDTKLNGTAPGYMYGYGSYGASIPDAFFSKMDLFRLIDRGFVFALSHPRGGSEMGKAWHENGKFLKKKNTFEDFIACGDYLVKNKIVAANKLTAGGGSAGGMLIGACINMRPDLFSAVAAHVPFVDVVNTMLDKTLLLTQMEYKEWGNPEDKKYYKYMKSYSPYDNVEAKAYPHLYITCGLNDQRVTYWEPAKWTAKLRELKTDNNTIVFKTNMGAGHFGASGRYEHLWEIAEEFAFFLNKVGITE